MTLRILVADDHDLVRRGIRDLLQSYPGWSICAEAKTGREAVAKAEVLKPDIAILDISMPNLNGLEAARKIRMVSPRTEVLILIYALFGSSDSRNYRYRSPRVHFEIRFGS